MPVPWSWHFSARSAATPMIATPKTTFRKPARAPPAIRLNEPHKWSNHGPHPRIALPSDRLQKMIATRATRWKPTASPPSSSSGRPPAGSDRPRWWRPILSRSCGIKFRLARRIGKRAAVRAGRSLCALYAGNQNRYFRLPRQLDCLIRSTSARPVQSVDRRARSFARRPPLSTQTPDWLRCPAFPFDRTGLYCTP